VEIRGLSLRAGYIRHACDQAVGETGTWGKFRGLEVVRSDIGCKKKSGGSLKGERGIVTNKAQLNLTQHGMVELQTSFSSHLTLTEIFFGSSSFFGRMS
jgi:hypothetical protein